MGTAKRWSDFTPQQKTRMIVSAAIQLVLAGLAWTDLAKRPAGDVNGPKPVWALVRWRTSSSADAATEGRLPAQSRLAVPVRMPRPSPWKKQRSPSAAGEASGSSSMLGTSSACTTKR